MKILELVLALVLFLRVLIFRIVCLLLFMLFPVALFGLAAVSCLFQVTETGWHAPELGVIYLEPRINTGLKIFCAIMGIGSFAVTVFCIHENWKFWLDILEGKFDPG